MRAWRYFFWLSALSIATMETSVAANPAETEIAIWQGLAYGMTPEEALPIIQGIAGVKRIKVIKAQRSNPARRLDIDYNSSKISLANLPFELGPVFENGRLKQVILASRNQCGSSVAEVYANLASGLKSKYSSSIAAPAKITESDFRQAARKSLISGDAEGVGTAFASESVAAVLTFQMKVEGPPPYPATYSKFSLALYNLAHQQYEQRKAECSGTGNQRMTVSIIYMTRAQYDAAIASSEESIKAANRQIGDQL